MKDRSRFYRWLLLLASLVTIAFLVGAAVRENYLAQWKTVQHDYREILREKATDDRGRELLARFRIEMKQASIPPLGAVDRCVTCHNGIDDPRMTDVANPHRVHPGRILEKHPVDRFGCTVCHHGQGAALTFREAKADDQFWDYPLLPLEMTEASCVACHDADRLPLEQISLLQAGMRLYRERSCGSCHKLGGRGGSLGPPLDDEGAKTKHQLTMVNVRPPHTAWRWQMAHLRDPGGVVPASQMRNPTVTEREALALTVFLLSRWRRDVPESYLAPDKIEQKYRELHAGPLSGEQVYGQFCSACHGEGTYGRWDKKFARFVPAIRGASLMSNASDAYLRANIEKGRPGTAMPAWGPHAGGLLPEEISAVIAFLRAGTPPVSAAPPVVARGAAARGLPLFLRSCAGCHGTDGRGGVAPEIGNPVFQEAATDTFIVRTIREGRAATAMPAFQRPGAPALTDEDVADVLAYLRTLGERPGRTASSREPAPAARSGGPS